MAVFLQFYNSPLSDEGKNAEDIQTQPFRINPYSRPLSDITNLFFRSKEFVELNAIGLQPHFVVLKLADDTEMLGIKTALALQDVPVGITICIDPCEELTELIKCMQDFYTRRKMLVDANGIKDAHASSKRTEGQLSREVMHLNWDFVDALVGVLSTTEQPYIDAITNALRRLQI